MSAHAEKLLTAIAKAGHTPVANLNRILDEVGGDESAFVARVAELGVLAESAAWHAYADVLGLAFVDAQAIDIDPAILRLVPADMIRSYKVLPLLIEDDALLVAMANPFDLLAVDALQEVAELPVTPAMCAPGELESAIEYQLRATGSVEKLLSNLDLTQVDVSAFANPQKLKEAAGDGAIVELVNHIVDNAVRRKASDVHVEPGAERLRVRLRIDGKLESWLMLPRPLHAAILSRIKILSKLDIAERRKPQDGRFEKTTSADRKVQFRVSILPAVHGEKAVLRVLDKNDIRLELKELGFRPKVHQAIINAASYPTGLILVTGPTGSGKTTSLYGILNHLNSDDRNLVTVEDPVEHELSGVTQVPVDSKAERTFASALRSILRQDPDVIMVGEIRDAETASTAIHAGLTGHMVLSTLHTNSAAGTVTRLVDMGVEPFLLAPTLRAVIAQRLVRRLCNQCKEPTTPDEGLLARFRIKPEQAQDKFYRAPGCTSCGGRGYRGRTPVQELLVWTPELAACLNQGGSEQDLLKIARQQGFESMLADGAHKAAAGLTSLEEVLTATRT